MSIKLPEKISYREPKLLEYSPQTDLLKFKLSFEKHFEAYQQTKETSELMSYFALMTAIEVYLKIHVVIFSYYAWIGCDENEKNTALKWLSLSNAQQNLGKDLKVSLKNSFSHEVISILKVIKEFINEIIEDSAFSDLIGKLQIAAGRDWVVKRYSVSEIPSRKNIDELFEKFETFQHQLKQKRLDVIDRITN